MLAPPIQEVIATLEQRQRAGKSDAATRHVALDLSTLRGMIQFELSHAPSPQYVVLPEKLFGHLKTLLDQPPPPPNPSSPPDQRFVATLSQLSLLSLLAPHISPAFYSTYAEPISEMLKRLLNAHSSNNEIILYLLQLFYFFLRSFLLSSTTEENATWPAALKELFMVGLFQFHKDASKKVREVAIKLVRLLCEVRSRLGCEVIGEALVSELDRAPIKTHILRLIERVILLLPSSIIGQLISLFLKQFLTSSSRYSVHFPCIFRILNSIICFETPLMPNEAYFSLTHTLLHQVNASKDVTFIFLLKNSILRKLIPLAPPDLIANDWPMIVTQFVSFYKHRSDAVALATTKCLKEMFQFLITMNDNIIVQDAYRLKRESCLWRSLMELRKGLDFWNVIYIPQILEVFGEGVFLPLGPQCCPMLNGLIREFVKIYNEATQALLLQKGIEVALSHLIDAIGPRQFFTVVPLNSFFATLRSSPTHNDEENEDDDDDDEDGDVDMENDHNSSTAGNAPKTTLWILTVLLSSVRNASLDYFFTFLVRVATSLKQRSENMTTLLPSDAFAYKAISYQLWNLFPRFCILPFDAPDILSPAIVTRLLATCTEDSVLRPVILRGFVRLVQGCRKVLTSNQVPDWAIRGGYGAATAEATLSVLSGHSRQILDCLMSLFQGVGGRGCRQVCGAAIAAIMSVSDPDVIQHYFRSVFHALMQQEEIGGSSSGGDVSIGEEMAMMVDGVMDEEEEDEGEGEVSSTTTTPAQASSTSEDTSPYETMNLAIELVPYLPPRPLQHLYVLLQSQLEDAESQSDFTLQKKTYRCLFEIAAHHPGFVASKQGHFYEMIVRNINSYTPASAKFRFKVLIQLFRLVDREILERGVREIMCEAVLGTMATNAEARTYSRELLLTLVNKVLFNDASANVYIRGKSLTPDEMQRLGGVFRVLFGGLAGQTSTMVSGTVNAFTFLCKRGFFELIHRAEVNVFLPIFRAILNLLKYESGDVFSSVLYFLKMVFRFLPKEELQPFIPPILVDAMVMYQRFSAGNRKLLMHVLLEKLIRVFGYEYVRAVFPRDHIALIRAVNHQLKRKIVKKKKEKSRKRKLNLKDRVQIRVRTGIDDLSGKGSETDFFSRSNAYGHIQTIAAGKRLDERDVMRADAQDTYEVVLEKDKVVIRERSQGEMEFAAGGKDRLVVADDSEDVEVQLTGRKRTFAEMMMDDFEDEELAPPLSKRIKISNDLERELSYVGKSEHYIQNAEKRRRQEARYSHINFGTSFRSRDGRSDVKRGNMDPHAYVPIDANILNRRMRGQPTSFDEMQTRGRRNKKKQSGRATKRRRL